MTKEELIKISRENLRKSKQGSLCECYDEAFIKGYELSKKHIAELEKENAELKKVAEFQQSSNMSRHFENKKLKEGLAVGSTFNKALNSMNKNLEEERDKYRNMVFDKDEQLTKAKVALRNIIDYLGQFCSDYPDCVIEAELFLKDCEVEK